MYHIVYNVSQTPNRPIQMPPKPNSSGYIQLYPKELVWVAFELAMFSFFSKVSTISKVIFL